MFIQGSNFREARNFVEQYANRNSIRVPNKIIEDKIDVYGNDYRQNLNTANIVNTANVMKTSNIIERKDSLVQNRDMQQFNQT